MKLDFDVEVHDILVRLDSDYDAAAKALRLAAAYMRSGEVLPPMLATHLADAIEASMTKPIKDRAKAFAYELKLTRKNRGLSGDRYAIGSEVDVLIGTGESQEKACAEIADKHGISERTTRKYLKYYRDGWEEIQRINDAESGKKTPTLLP